MALYTIADLHLSLGVGKDKSMDVFGRRWQGYVEKLEKNWRAIVEPEDAVVLPGDISWALGIDEAREDLKFIDALPGTKYIGKGNHDFWWSTLKKLNEFFDANGITTIRILYNCAFEVEDYIICGTRGWFYDDTLSGIPENTDFDKLVNREAQRLKLSLDAAKALQEKCGKPILCFLHFPPVWNGTACEPFIALLREYGIQKCYFGHIHGAYDAPPCFEHEGISFALVAADYLSFIPRVIFPPEV